MGKPVGAASVAVLMKGVVKAMMLKKLTALSAVLALAGGMLTVGGHQLADWAAAVQAETPKSNDKGNAESLGKHSTAAAETASKNNVESELTASALVDYLNDNAARVNSLRCASLGMRLAQGMRSF